MQEAGSFFEALAFRYEWRKYQGLVLDLFEHRDPAKRTFHVVAPPGSGKTLVDIEKARRIEAGPHVLPSHHLLRERVSLRSAVRATSLDE